MDILTLNKQAWDKIGSKTASPYISHEKYLEVFTEFCNALEESAAVLDFGCGPGIPFTKELVKRGFEVTAIDISDTMVQQASQNVPEASYQCVSMTDIEFHDHFDGIFSGYTMLCLDPKNFEIAAKKAVNALKSQGLFFLAINEPGPEGHDEEESFVELLDEQMYSRPYTEAEVREVFEPLGMKTLRVARETVHSEAYGDEYTLLMLMQKQ